jgi:hypothetical protein
MNPRGHPTETSPRPLCGPCVLPEELKRLNARVRGLKELTQAVVSTPKKLDKTQVTKYL